MGASEVLPLQHLQDPGFVGTQIVCLELEPLLQFGDPPELPILLLQELRELLLVLAGFPQIVLVVRVDEE